MNNWNEDDTLEMNWYTLPSKQEEEECSYEFEESFDNCEFFPVGEFHEFDRNHDRLECDYSRPLVEICGLRDENFRVLGDKYKYNGNLERVKQDRVKIRALFDKTLLRYRALYSKEVARRRILDADPGSDRIYGLKVELFGEEYLEEIRKILSEETIELTEILSK